MLTRLPDGCTHEQMEAIPMSPLSHCAMETIRGRPSDFCYGLKQFMAVGKIYNLLLTNLTESLDM